MERPDQRELGRASLALRGLLVHAFAVACEAMHDVTGIADATPPRVMLGHRRLLRVKGSSVARRALCVRWSRAPRKCEVRGGVYSPEDNAAPVFSCRPLAGTLVGRASNHPMGGSRPGEGTPDARRVVCLCRLSTGVGGDRGVPRGRSPGTRWQNGEWNRSARAKQKAPGLARCQLLLTLESRAEVLPPRHPSRRVPASVEPG